MAYSFGPPCICLKDISVMDDDGLVLVVRTSFSSFTIFQHYRCWCVVD